MVSRTDAWLGQHGAIYERILADLRANPVSGTAADFLSGRVFTLFAEILDHHAYTTPDESGHSRYSPNIPDNTSVLYWDGMQLGSMPYNARKHGLSDYVQFAQSIIRRDGEPLIVDLGAGTSLQAIVLRAMGCNFPVLSLDMFRPALEIGEILSFSLGLGGIAFGSVNLGSAENLAELGGKLPRNRPIWVISRHAIYPFYAEAEYRRLFDWLINEIGVAGGIHLERTGRFTPSFARLQQQFQGDLPIPAKHRGKLDDPLAHLAGRPDIAITERLEIWPHYLETYFPSYLVWSRK